MSGFSKYANRSVTNITQHEDKEVTTFEGGTAYKLSPLNAARLSLASGICGEPQFYRPKGKNDKRRAVATRASKFSIFGDAIQEEASFAQFQENLIDAALDEDFKATLELGKELRDKYMMRLNPAVLFVRAAMHKERAKFNQENGDLMRKIGIDICQRADDPVNMFEYYCYANGSKKGLPSILKRVWKDVLESLNRYKVNKYKGTGGNRTSLIDIVRISHAHNEIIDELMKTGTLEVEEGDQTWETLKSAGKTWTEIWKQLGRLPHMALLRNLRNIFQEINDKELAKEILEELKNGVPHGKQFPFRYLSAYRELDGSSKYRYWRKQPEKKDGKINHQTMVLTALEYCMDEAVKNLPTLSGRTVCLSDASGSMTGYISEKSTVSHCDISVLSGVTSAMKSEDGGEVIMFDDNFDSFAVNHRDGILGQAKKMIDRVTGGGTYIEPPIRDMIRRGDKFDNMFVFTDMQIADHFLPVIEEYRRKVNPKLNVFIVQTSGYGDSAIPEHIYRGAILTGWTGKEPEFAKAVIDIWDEVEGA
jgi:polyhydroxyalkanoate synthesis regulator phasin